MDGDDVFENNCYPDDPTPTIVSTIYTAAALTAAFCVCVAGGIVGYRKAKTKKLSKLEQKQQKLKEQQQLQEQLRVQQQQNKDDDDSKQNTSVTTHSRVHVAGTETKHVHKQSPGDTVHDKKTTQVHQHHTDPKTTTLPQKVLEETGANIDETEEKKYNDKNNDTIDRDVAIIVGTYVDEEEKKDGRGMSIQDALQSEQLTFSVCDKKFIWYFLNYTGKEAWNKKRCYIPFITHIIDQATDIAVIIKFYQIYQFENANNYDCPKINGAYLFWLSIASFSMYRIVSCIWVYNITNGKIVDTLSQIFDLKLYHALYINFVLNKDVPSNPQRYLQILEASLESFPQCVVQLYYLIKVGINNYDENNNDSLSNEIILISLIFSVLNISSKMVSEDKVFFPKEWHSLNFRWNCADEDQMSCVNFLYLIRLCLRLFDIVHRLLLILLTWIILGGTVVFIYLCFEFIGLLIISARLKKYVHIQRIVYLSINIIFIVFCIYAAIFFKSL